MSATMLQKATRADEVAAYLREAIISGRLPAGAVVAEIPTAERLAVSRVPVREATLVLEREGMLVFDDRGRCRVRTLMARDLVEIYDMRLMLECECSRRAAIHRTEQQLAAMEANIARMARARRLSRVTLLDIEFHDLIVDAAAHSRLAHLWEIMRGQVQLVTALVQREVNQCTASVRETSVAAHREILDAIRSGEQDAAVAISRKHLSYWQEWLLDRHSFVPAGVEVGS